MSKTSAEVKNRWNAKNYDRIALMLPKGYKDMIRNIVGASGSVNGYIRTAIDEKMKKDGQA